MQNHNHHNVKENIFEKIFSFTNIIIILILALVSFFIWNKMDTVKKELAPVNVSVSNGDNRIGKADSKVTVIEYLDFQCPACKAMEDITVPVMAEYSDRVNFVVKNFPLTQIHQNAMLAATAVEAAAKQNKFWEMKKVVYEKQAEWSSALDAKDKFISYAVSIGLNISTFEKDLNSEVVKEKILTDLKEANSIKLQGTPSFVINGMRVDTSEIGSVEKFKAYLDKELVK